MIFVLTGNGKGKTTSAIGMGLRAVGSGRKVLMVQFLKDGRSSEIKAIKKIKNFQVGFFGRPGFGPYSEKDSQLAKSGFIFVKKACQQADRTAQVKKYPLLILDEINVALNFKLIGVKEFTEFLEEYGRKLDIVLTGRYCPKEIMKIVDLVTEFKEIKHYFKKSCLSAGGSFKARKGIEY